MSDRREEEGVGRKEKQVGKREGSESESIFKDLCVECA